MKTKIFLLLLVLSTNLFAFFNMFESEKITNLKSAIEKDANNINLHVQLANEYYNEFLQSQSESDIENAYISIKTAQSLSPMNLQLSAMCYDIGFTLVRVSKNTTYLNELRQYFNTLNSAKMNVAPISFLESIITPYNEGSLEQHVLLLKKALKENNKFVITYLALSETYLELKKYDLALQIAKIGSNLEPKNDKFYLLQAVALKNKIEKNENNNNCDLFNHKQNDEIISLFKKSIQLNPKDSTFAKHSLSTMYNRTGKNKLSIFLIKQLLEQDPENINNQLTLIESYTEDLQINESKKLLKALTPSNETQENWYNLEYAYIYMLEQNWDKAADHLKKFLDGSKTDNFYRYLAYSVITHKNNPDSFKDLDNLPKNVKISDWNKELKSFVQNKITEKELLSKADNICKKSEALYNIGMVNLLKGEEEIAKEYFKDTIEFKVYSYVEYMRSKYYLKQLK